MSNKPEGHGASQVSGNVSVPRETVQRVLDDAAYISQIDRQMLHAILAMPAAPIERPTWESLARRLAYYLPNTLATHQQYMTPETMHDALEALDQVRKMLAAPIEQPREIPAAGGEVEVLAWLDYSLDKRVQITTKGAAVAKQAERDSVEIDLVDRAHITRLQAGVVTLSALAEHNAECFARSFARI